MKKLKYFLLIILIVLFVPIVPYENEISNGVTIVGNRAVIYYLYDYVKENYLKEGPRSSTGLEHSPYKGKTTGSSPAGATNEGDK